MENDKKIIHVWGHKIVKATELRVAAQKSAKIAHAKYLEALKLKMVALKEMKAA
jgi:hypothetical protein